MNTPKAIQSLADKRIIEAELLYSNGHYDLALYVAGYAVELYLKARICLVLNMPDFFDFGNRKRFENEDNITKPYKVHNFTQLLILSGLFQEHDTMMNIPDFKDDWWVIKRWSESERYSSGKSQEEVKGFIKSTKNFIVWIKLFL